MPYDAPAKRSARAYVARVRAATVCERCGGQPVEWHNVEHETYPNRRIAHLVALGFPIERIQAEIDVGEALCRSCHMQVDGRAVALTANRPFKAGDKQPPKPCAECGVLSNPLWRGKCRRCYDRERRA